jgi:hypothetical protein
MRTGDCVPWLRIGLCSNVPFPTSETDVWSVGAISPNADLELQKRIQIIGADLAGRLFTGSSKVTRLEPHTEVCQVSDGRRCTKPDRHWSRRICYSTSFRVGCKLPFLFGWYCWPWYCWCLMKALIPGRLDVGCSLLSWILAPVQLVCDVAGHCLHYDACLQTQTPL